MRLIVQCILIYEYWYFRHLKALILTLFYVLSIRNLKSQIVINNTHLVTERCKMNKNSINVNL